MERREFLRTLVGGVSLSALDWDSLPRGKGGTGDRYDAVIIGAGLGGLSCAAAFARQGFRPLVLERQDKPGGYATTFSRPGGFTFDASLHSTTVGERNGVLNQIPGVPEITDVKFVLLPSLYRAVYPEHTIIVPQKNVAGYMEILCSLFPGERQGIMDLFGDMKGLSQDVEKFSRGNIDMARFQEDAPVLSRCFSLTWGQMMDFRLRDPKLKGILSSLWGYFGLPPSRLSCFYYALPLMGYLQSGGCYPAGRSQAMSNAIVRFIESRGGNVLLNTGVKEILTGEGTARGVRTDDGREFLAKAVVSNVSTHETFRTMLNQPDFLKEYLGNLDRYSVSLSCFQVFLGLKTDLVKAAGIADSEIFFNTGYDHERSYASAVKADLEGGPYGLTLYDNVYSGYSPAGKNTVNIMVLQGYDHWKEYESDYFKGKKEAYRLEKERMAAILIRNVEETLLPGLSGAVEVMEIGTPLTNVRYTGNYRGAIYGWDQTVDNSGNRRLGHGTPLKNLYLAGAWTRPGHGYPAVLSSGVECFGEIMKSW
jgi:all-trans-retinol 13,14-reductase